MIKIASKLPSIQKRLTISLLSISLCFSAFTTGVTWFIVNHELDEFLEHELKETGEIIQHLILTVESHGVALKNLTIPANLQGEDQLAWQVVDAQFKTVLGRSRFAPMEPMFNHHTPSVQPSENREWNGLSIPFAPSNQRWLIVAQADKEHKEAQHETVVYTLISSLVSSFLVALMLGLGIRKELQPLRRLSQRVRRYNPLQPESVLGAAERKELEPIHQSLLDLGDRLAKRIASEQAFLAHAAHALRTPVAGIDAQLAVAIKEAQGHVITPRLMQARQAAKRLGQIMRALLALFRSGLEPKKQSVGLTDLIEATAWTGLEFEVQGNACIEVDPDLFAAVFFNLFDNAQRHEAKHIRIHLRETEGGLQHIEIEDDGRGCEPERFQALQAALRSPAVSQGSHGLGLALAQLVMRAHGGRMELASPIKGFVVHLFWPK